ncbi:MAG: hypothetical protein IPK22_19835 [Verrucomicrobiaceae bacterium]|nr:hypothetical protein [Verrucomicrobiaceae bacterium]
MLQFQRLELLLKHLLRCHQGSYTVESLADEIPLGLKEQEKRTLGGLAGDLFQKVIQKKTDGDEDPAHGADPTKFSHRFVITTSEENHQEWHCRLKALVEERNQLVHLSLLTWDLETIEGCQAVVAELDERRGRIGAELEKVILYHDSMMQCLEHLHEDLKRVAKNGETK